MYTNDKNNRITLRLNDEQFEFVRESAETLGVSPSEFLRMVINSTLAVQKRAKAITETAIEILNKEGVGRENDKANLNNLV